MTFLKKLGLVLAKGLQIIIGFGPAVAAFVPGSAGVVTKVQSELEQIAAVIGNVEAVGVALQLAGAAKLTAAAPLVAQVILQSSLLVGHKIGDEAKFQAGAQKIADGMADVLNSLKADGLTVVDKS